MVTQKFTPILLKGMHIYTENVIIKNGYLIIQEQTIVEIGSIENLIKDHPHLEKFDIIDIPANYSAVPGFIDIHIHGANGADAMDATPQALETIAKALPKEGTTSFLATTMTQETSAIEQALTNAGNYITQPQPQGQAEIIGIHLEGPFVNKKRAGAQPQNYIIDPDEDTFKRWNTLANDKIKLVTLASERPGGLDLVSYLAETGIVASLGHTDSTYDQVDEAIKAGAKQVTHLYNQMRELHHREPGVVGAAYLREELKTEIIVDGVHSRPEMVKLAYIHKGKKGFILITDAMRAKGLPDGDYELGGQAVAVKDGKATLGNGTLAGSVLKMNQAVKNTVNFTGCSVSEAFEMASMNPAKQLNIANRKGSLAVGKDADIVILDENLDVFMTYCRGNLAYQKENKNMNLIEAKDYQDLSKKAADYLIERIRRTPNINLGLATGGTPEGTYQLLIEDHQKNHTTYKNVTSFNLDEYIGLSGDNPQSYRYFMDQKLFNHIDIEKSRTHVPKGNAADMEQECADYEKLIEDHGGIDLQILGIGINGHIAFNEPGTSFDSKTQVIELTQSTIEANARYFNSPDEVPSQAITMGISTIMKGKEILLLISGENKRDTLSRLLNGEISEDFSASVLKNHPNVTIIADKAALGN